MLVGTDCEKLYKLITGRSAATRGRKICSLYLSHRRFKVDIRSTSAHQDMLDEEYALTIVIVKLCTSQVVRNQRVQHMSHVTGHITIGSVQKGNPFIL